MPADKMMTIRLGMRLLHNVSASLLIPHHFSTPTHLVTQHGLCRPCDSCPPQSEQHVGSTTHQFLGRGVGCASRQI